MTFRLSTFAICSLLAVFVCGSSALAEPGGTPPAQVTVINIEKQDVPVRYEYVGQLAASNETEIHARVDGVIEKRLYDEGQTVAAGQVLFQLETAPLTAKVDQAKAALAIARAERARAVAQLKKAKRDLARVAPLSEKALLSQSNRDDATSAVDIAEAGVLQAEAAIQQAKANLDSALINLSYTTIKAPFAGIAGRAVKQAGALVQAGRNSLLTTLAAVDPIYVNFGIAGNEQQMLRQALDAGQLLLPESGFQIALKIADGDRFKQTGQINFQDYKVDQKTGNVAMRASLENSDHALLPGQFVRVLLLGAKRPQSIAIPQRAVLDNPQGKYVYVAEKNEQGGMIAQQRTVEVGDWVQLEEKSENAWLITSGLQAGDQVVIEGMARIFFPGMPVQISSDDKAETANAPPAE